MTASWNARKRAAANTPVLNNLPGFPSIYTGDPPSNTLSGADEWPGGVWFDPNGWLTWAYASLQGTLPGAAMAELRAFMFDRVYLGPEATREHAKIAFVVRTLFDHLCAHPREIPGSIPDGSLAERVRDHIAGMTDRFCIRAFEAISVPVAFAS